MRTGGMATKRCFYEVLEVTRTCTVDEIKVSYRKLAMKWHPDRNPGDSEAEARFKEIQEAYQVLNDPEKRARYDRYGHAGMDQAAGFESSGFGGDIFDLFSDFFGGGGGRNRRRSQGEDIQMELVIDLGEAARGITRVIKIQKSEACLDCSGSGCKPGTKKTKCRRCNGQGVSIQGQGFFRIQRTCQACGGTGETITDPCRTCSGSGTRKVAQEVEVRIPPGVDDGVTLRLSGHGEMGPANGMPGDLYVVLRVQKHPFFQRDGANLICEIPVTIPQAVLGDTLELPCLIGDPVKVEINPGIQSGDVLRLAGKGMPHLKGNRMGDLLVQVRIDTPKKLTPRQIELYRELKQIEDQQPQTQTKTFFDRIRDFFSGSTETKSET